MFQLSYLIHKRDEEWKYHMIISNVSFDQYLRLKILRSFCIISLTWIITMIVESSRAIEWRLYPITLIHRDDIYFSFFFKLIPNDSNVQIAHAYGIFISRTETAYLPNQELLMTSHESSKRKDFYHFQKLVVSKWNCQKKLRIEFKSYHFIKFVNLIIRRLEIILIINEKWWSIWITFSPHDQWKSDKTDSDFENKI